MCTYICRQINVEDPDSASGAVVSVYMDTSEGELLYDPTISNDENLAEEMHLEEVPGQKHHTFLISNQVITHMYLTITSSRVRSPDSREVYKVKFQEGGGTHWIRTQYTNDERQTKYAFHTKKGSKIFYLLPFPDKEEDGHRSKTIRAVEMKDTSSTHVFT